MSTALDVAQDFKNLYNNLVGAQKQSLVIVGRELLMQLRAASPIKFGAFRDAWRSEMGPDSVSITNDAKQASSIELGSARLEWPWPNARERTVENSGRVWSSQAVGGIIGPMFKGPVGAKLADLLVSGIDKGLKW